MNVLPSLPDDLRVTWIAGLMRENYEAVGFIPDTTIKSCYLANGQYILQTDERGIRVGYLLHGVMLSGRPVVISQHCIQYEKRLRGYGEVAVKKLIDRCISNGVTSIKLRCAEDLPALFFWQSLGFSVTGIVNQNNRSNRLIGDIDMPLDLPMFKGRDT